MKGLAFVELLLVIAIIGLLLALTIPLGFNFYNRQQFDVTAEGVTQALRRARFQAMSQADYSFGVYFDSGQYILFRGDSFKHNDDEELFGVSRSISFGGLSEIVFSKLEGIPSVTGDVILISGGDTRTVNINERGRINYE